MCVCVRAGGGGHKYSSYSEKIHHFFSPSTILRRRPTHTPTLIPSVFLPIHGREALKGQQAPYIGHPVREKETCE